MDGKVPEVHLVSVNPNEKRFVVGPTHPDNHTLTTQAPGTRVLREHFQVNRDEGSKRWDGRVDWIYALGEKTRSAHVFAYTKQPDGRENAGEAYLSAEAEWIAY